MPPNVAVEQDGSAILGGFGEAGGVWSNHNTVGASQSAAPVTLRVVGTALMGRVNAVVNHRAKPAVLLSAEEVERILREVPPEPSTTVQDFMAHAMQAGIEKICFLDCFWGCKGSVFEYLVMYCTYCSQDASELQHSRTCLYHSISNSEYPAIPSPM